MAGHFDVLEIKKDGDRLDVLVEIQDDSLKRLVPAVVPVDAVDAVLDENGVEISPAIEAIAGVPEHEEFFPVWRGTINLQKGEKTKVALVAELREIVKSRRQGWLASLNAAEPVVLDVATALGTLDKDLE